MRGFLPVGQPQEMDATRNKLFAQESTEWTPVINKPLNEYQAPILATLTFPTLFPDYREDPTNQALLTDVPLQEKIKHLIKFGENADSKWVYRFASHPIILGFKHALEKMHP